MITLHKFLITLIVVSFVVFGITGFMSQTAVIYGLDSNNFTQMNSSFNKMNELNNQVTAFKNNESVKTDSSISDILGAFFTNMYQSAKILRGSVDVAGDMVDSAVDELPIGSTGTYLKTSLWAILIVFMFVGIFLAFVTKSERT